MFGLYERESGVGVIELVDARDANSLLPLIHRHVRLGSIIHSDGWGAYNNVGNLGYVHRTVIHADNFVDPVTGVHSNGIEGYWARAKQRIKAVYGSMMHHIPSYIDEFM